MTGYGEEAGIVDTENVVAAGGPGIPRDTRRGGGGWIRRQGCR